MLATSPSAHKISSMHCVSTALLVWDTDDDIGCQSVLTAASEPANKQQPSFIN